MLQAIVNVGLKQGSSYRFRLHAINRVGVSRSPASRTFTVQRSQSRDNSFVAHFNERDGNKVQTSGFHLVKAQVPDTIVVQAVHPVTNATESLRAGQFYPHRPFYRHSRITDP